MKGSLKLLVIGIILMLVSISFVSNVNSISVEKEVETDKDIEILNDPPEVWHELDPAEPDGKNGWYNTNVKISLFAEDEDGIWGIFFHINDGMCNGEYVNPRRMTYMSPFTVGSEGGSCVSYKAVDKRYKESEIKGFDFKIDKTPPRCELLKNRTGLTEIKFTVKAKDYYASGIELVELYVDDVLYDSQRPPETLKSYQAFKPSFNWSGVGKHEVKAIAYDKSGWITESETLYTTKSKNIARIFDCFPIFSRLLRLI